MCRVAGCQGEGGRGKENKGALIHLGEDEAKRKNCIAMLALAREKQAWLLRPRGAHAWMGVLSESGSSFLAFYLLAHLGGTLPCPGGRINYLPWPWH